MKKCAICKKSGITAGKRKKLRGKYNPTKKEKKYPNLQWVKLPSGKRVLLCSKCKKSLLKEK